MKLLFCFASILWTASAYKILVMNPLPSKSHHHLGKGIVKALLGAGHEVTWVTPFPDEVPAKGLIIVDVSSILGDIGSLDASGKNLQGLSQVKELTRNIFLANIHHPAVKELLVKKQYDAVVTEWFMTDMEAGFAAIQQVPWILFSSTVMHPHLESLVDSVRSVTTVPMMMTKFNTPMSFPERIVNTMLFYLLRFDTWRASSTTEALYKASFAPLAKARGVNLPPFSAALHNISILFVNSHPLFATAQSLPPNVVEVGGYHIDVDVPPLPKDLQDLLDSSPQGAIYFSMGSILKSSTLPKSTKQELVKLFGKLPYTVLWKYEEHIENLPKNVHIRKWFPQNSVLSHPNVKIFMSHSGLLSTLESLYFGIPMVAIPVFGDQMRNAEDSVKSGRALKVTFSADMVPQLEDALEEMTNNVSYFNTAKHLSKLFRARPVSPSKMISFYIELAIESRGAYHLRSKALLYEWYEIHNVDVLVVALLMVAIVYIICRSVFRVIWRCFKKSANVNQDKKKKY